MDMLKQLEGHLNGIHLNKFRFKNFEVQSFQFCFD